ncbi:MAG TPA: TolC family protein [Bacteroidales bacterium]
MRRTICIVILLIIFRYSEISAQQKKWTLEDCVNYAVSNNIGLQRQRLQTETSEINLLKSKMDVLPSLNFGSDARVGFGRSIDPVTNLITFKQNLSNSYSLNSSIQLFNGFASLNTISANKFMLKAGLENEKIMRNTLVVDIMGQYYLYLYARGLESASQMQLDLSQKQLFRILKMVETGKEALSRQYEIESRVSADKLSYTIAQNNSSQALTTMKQMLQLEPGSEFDILMPDLNNILITDSKFNTDSVYLIASQTLPRLKAIDFELKASIKQVAASKGAIAPRLSAGGAAFTGFYKVINDPTSDQGSFSSQIKNNNSQSIFLSLDVPIFNNYNTGRNIKMAKIRKNDAILKLELEKNNLYTEIENACLNFSRGKDEFSAAAANFEYNKKSFSAVEKKFESGLVDVTDYTVAKTTLFNAETEALRTRLQLLIMKLTIQFYLTGEYENLVFN